MRVRNMAFRKVKLVEHETYHVYNRGSFRHEIFHDLSDYERFLKILYLSNGTKRFKYKDLLKYGKNIYEYDKGDEIVNVLTYVLMPNHFHLLIQIKPFKKDKKQNISQNLDNNLSVFMKRVTSSYSMYYNRKYNKTGNLFEGKFKAEHVGDTNYFKYLFAYIHLNPVSLIQKNWKQEGIKDLKQVNDFLHEYQYSSFLDYFNYPKKIKGTEKIINKKTFYSVVPVQTDLSKEIFDWLKFKTIRMD
jgi:REP element-mobilizing transposase RayT